MAELFGFQITRTKPKVDPKQSFTQPKADDGTQTSHGGYFGQYSIWKVLLKLSKT